MNSWLECKINENKHSVIWKCRRTKKCSETWSNLPDNIEQHETTLKENHRFTRLLVIAMAMISSLPVDS